MRLRRPDLQTVGWTLLAAAWIAVALFYGWVHSPAWAAPPGDTVASGIAALKGVDYPDAHKIFSALAKSGNRQAETWLGYMDENGLGAPASGSQAVAWYTKAATAGSPEAARRLGELYLKGNVVLQDVAKARQWMQTAAEQGDLVAARDLGEIYARGIGGAKDPVEAYVWLDIAASHDDWQAARDRDNLLTALQPEALGRAEAEAARTLQSISARHRLVKGNPAVPLEAPPEALLSS